MRQLLYLVTIMCTGGWYAQGQVLAIDSTRFITGTKCCTSIDYAMPTADKGILFTGQTTNRPGGIIPFFSIDTVLTNVLVGKIDSNQQISWIKVYGGSQEEGAGPSCQTPDGGYAVLAGTTSSNGNVTGFKGATDIWLLRLDASGNLLWQKTYGSGQSDGAVSIAQTPDNGFIILGRTNGSDGDVPFHYGDFFSMDWLVIKTDSEGNVEWSRDYGTINDDGIGSILAIDSYYYLISNAGTGDHDCMDTTWHVGVPTGYDVYIFKLDDTGKILWAKSYGGTGSDGAYHAIFDERDSTIVTCGFTFSGNYMVTGYEGGGDIWVLKTDRSGNVIWQKTLGSTGEEKGYSICAAHDGGYIAYGSTRYVIGGGDGWLFKLDNAGNEITNKVFGGTDNELPYSVVPYLNGYAATGFSLSSIFTDGTTYGRFSNGAYISYIGYWPLAVNNISGYTTPVLVAYPNPTEYFFNISAPAVEAGELAVINMLGQPVFYERVKQGAGYVIINAELWASGVYSVIWKGEGGEVLRSKLVKL